LVTLLSRRECYLYIPKGTALFILFTPPCWTQIYISYMKEISSMLKFKQSRWLVLLVLVLAAALLLVACGDDDDDDGDNHDLSQTFESATGVTVQYPDGWAARDGDSGPEIANGSDAFDAMDLDDETEIPEDAFAMMIFDPGQMADLPGLAEMDAKALLEMMADFFAGEDEDGMQIEGDVSDTKVGDIDGVKLSISDDQTKSDGLMVAYKLDGNTAVLAIFLSREGKLDEYEDTAMDVLGSVTYTAPAVEEGAEG
jgi:hypothetical protein